MEAKNEENVECAVTFMTEPASILKGTRQDSPSIPPRTGKASILTYWADVKTESSKIKKRSFELNRMGPLLPQKVGIRKTKSLSAHFLINVDDLTMNNNVVQQEDDENSDQSQSLLQIDDHDQDGTDSYHNKKMHLDPTLPIYLKFEDVKYNITVKGEKNEDAKKWILQGITGSVHPGDVLALMGPSGGGKTTLLNILSGRVKHGSGSITYNDHPYDKSLKQRIGFVLQDDIVFPHLTVKESLTYVAMLRLPNTLSRQQKKDRVTDVIHELALERCQDTIIGGRFTRGVSGGERKRLCIGNEILLNPSLLFLDEPTSGLDSTTALRIVQMLHNLAQAGKTVVATIHQPSSRLFAKFDKLILLGKGSFLYSGKASEAMPYFSSIGCSPYIAMNPAEFLIDLANGNMKDKTVPSELEDKFCSRTSRDLENRKILSPCDVHEYLVGAYEARVALTKRKLLKPILIENDHSALIPEYCLNPSYNEATWFEQFSVLFERGLKERRHEYLSSVRVIQVISTAIIVGLLWWQSDGSSPKQVREQAGLLFFISVFWAFFPLFMAIFTFPQERAVLAKERSVGMYKLSAYFFARNISDVPLDIIFPVIFLVIVYFMVGLKPSFTAFSLTLCTIFLTVIAAQGLGQAIGAAFLDVRKATTLASITVMAFMLSGGFFVQNVPSFMSWVRYVSFNYHTYRLLLKIQYSCSGSEKLCKYPFIKRQNLDWSGFEVGAMLLMIIGYRFVVYFFLRRMKLRTLL